MNTPCDVYSREASVVDSTPDRFVGAVRVHTAFTAGLEKRLLVWMAGCTPTAITPDDLTALAIVSQVLAGAAYAAASRDPRALWIVNFFLALNWLGDSLDGTLARVRNRQRPRYGFYVDHIADAFGALALIAGMGWSGYVHWQIAVGMLVCFYMLSIESFLATYTLGRFHLSHGIFGPTEMRLLLAAGNVFLTLNPYAVIGGRRFLLFDLGGSVAIVGMTAMVLAATVRHVGALYREETLQ